MMPLLPLLLLLLLLLRLQHCVQLLSVNPLLLQQLLPLLLVVLLLLALRLITSLLCQQLLQLCHVFFHEPAQTVASGSTCCSYIHAAATAWCREMVCSTL
jgi:hypothetical protein